MVVVTFDLSNACQPLEAVFEADCSSSSRFPRGGAYTERATATTFGRAPPAGHCLLTVTNNRRQYGHAKKI